MPPVVAFSFTLSGHVAHRLRSIFATRQKFIASSKMWRPPLELLLNAVTTWNAIITKLFIIMSVTAKATAELAQKDAKLSPILLRKNSASIFALTDHLLRRLSAILMCFIWCASERTKRSITRQLRGPDISGRRPTSGQDTLVMCTTITAITKTFLTRLNMCLCTTTPRVVNLAMSAFVS